MDLAALCIALASAGVGDAVPVSAPAWGLGQVHEGAEGSMDIAGQFFRFGFWLPDDFPASLPKVWALSEELRELPHVDERGEVCCFEVENTLLDYRYAAELVQQTISKARRVIEDGLLGRNVRDFRSEFEAYWPIGTPPASVVTAGADPHPIKASYEHGSLLALADTTDALGAAFPHLQKQLRNGLYLPVDEARLGAQHPRQLCAWNEATSVLTLESKNLAASISVMKGQSLPVVLGIPSPDGARALVGMVLRKFLGGGSLLEAAPTSVDPFRLRRFDREYARGRLFATTSAQRIVVVGCGAVGGHVAHALAWTGVRELTLVDPDSCDAGNTFRHVLGRAGWGAKKVTALKRELERCVPGLDVVAIPKPIGEVLTSTPEVLKSADIVVVAIGNQTIPLQLNDLFAARKEPANVIYTWLEPYGIGGHSIAVRYGARGCLRCLFDDAQGLTCTIEFAESGQTFAVREAGCRALYTPYADLDARATALQAARLASRASEGDPTQGWRSSWRGDATKFLSAGFRLSGRYHDSSAQLEAPLEPRAGCVACGG